LEYKITPYRYPRYLKGKLETHHDANTRQGTKFNNDQIKIKRQVNTWAIALRESPIGWNPAQAGYAAESPFPCWPLGFLTFAHINKSMIIAKRENHTNKTYNKQKGKLEQKMVYHIITYNVIVQDA